MKMKKITQLFALIFMMVSSGFSQSLVSTSTEQKNAVLEEFTGIHCQFCPEGHAIGNKLVEDYPGRVVLINIHQGGYAKPSSGEPDFRTEFGDQIAAQSKLTGYPAGTINRHVFTGGITAMGRGSWTSAAQQIITENSPVNIGASSVYDSTTRELTINVELFYTDDSPQSTNYLNVALTQSKIYGPQVGGNAGNNYEHNHMLRYLITGQWGEEITTTTKGSFIEKTYKYVVPEDYNDVKCIVENCKIAVFVSESHQEIYSGIDIPAVDGTTLITGVLNKPAQIALAGSPSTKSSFNLDFTSFVPDTSEFIFTLTSSDAPDSWSSSITINGNNYEDSSALSLVDSVKNDISVNITPDAESGIATYILSISSVSVPNAPLIIQEFYVVSNVSNLLLHNQGSWNGGSPKSFEDDFFAAFDSAQIPNYASCDYKEFLAIADVGILDTFKNIFFNTAWTFPSLTDKNIIFFSDFIDNGGNFFISGQDIGWDTWDKDGNGTDKTREFYKNYLSAKFKADGSTSNNSISTNTADEIFWNIGTSPIKNVYGGSNMYPDELVPINDGHAILFYKGNSNKVAAIRSQKGDSKIVYMGFEPSMITKADVRNELIKTIFNWFEGVAQNVEWHDVVVNEFLASSDSLSGIADQDGEFDDWIELYNNTDHNISLSNVYLTDKFSKLQAWQFPEGTSIDAKGYLIVWADKDTDQEGLHAKLKLSSGGEELALTNGDGSFIDSLTFGAQTTNVAMARVPNGTGDFVFKAPTFNGNNVPEAVVELDEKSIVIIYPVPTTNHLNIEFEGSIINYQIRVMNTMGQLFLTKEMNSNKNILDISSLHTGQYILQIYSKGKLLGNTRFSVIK